MGNGNNARDWDELDKLLGIFPTKLFINADQSILYIETAAEIFEITTCSDCCSETWFADIIGVDNLLCEDTIGIEILDLPDPKDDRTRQDYDLAYGFVLKTKKGNCEFIYRNSSNGYYGGDIDNVNRIETLPADVSEILGDWSV